MPVDASIKKRIVIFIPVFPVYSETFIEREIKELSERTTLDITVVSLKKGFEGNYPSSKTTQYIALSVADIITGFILFLITNPLGLAKTLTLSLQNSNRNLIQNKYLWLKSIGFAKLFAKYSPDQIHAHFFSEPSTIALFAAILLKKKFSISGHARDVFAKSEVPQLNGELVIQKVNYSRFAVLCNKKAYDYCLNEVLPADASKVKLLYHGLPVDLPVIPQTPVPNAIPQICYVGRFVEKKGLHYLIEALKILNDKGEIYTLVLAGYGELYEKLKQQVTELGLQKYVSFPNEGKGVDIKTGADLLSRCSVFVTPNIDLDEGDSDGIPNNILEAGLQSKPVITTDAGSILELVKDGENAMIVPQKDSGELALAISKVINDPALQKKLGDNLNRTVRDKFDIKRNIIKLEELLLA